MGLRNDPSQGLQGDASYQIVATGNRTVAFTCGRTSAVRRHHLWHAHGNRFRWLGLPSGRPTRRFSIRRGQTSRLSLNPNTPMVAMTPKFIPGRSSSFHSRARLRCPSASLISVVESGFRVPFRPWRTGDGRQSRLRRGLAAVEQLEETGRDGAVRCSGTPAAVTVLRRCEPSHER